MVLKSLTYGNILQEYERIYYIDSTFILLYILLWVERLER
jgi:hypothetical protein